MKEFIPFIIIGFLFFGCSATQQDQLQINNINDIKNVKNLTELNQLLPAKVNDDTILVSVIKKKRNTHDIFVYNYRLINYEKGFIDIEQLQMETHVKKCSTIVDKDNGMIATYSYSDRNSAYIGEFNFSKQTCIFLFYIYKNEPERFKKYLKSLSDIDFMNMGINSSSSLLQGEFKTIFGDRLFDTDLNVE